MKLVHILENANKEIDKLPLRAFFPIQEEIKKNLTKISDPDLHTAFELLLRPAIGENILKKLLSNCRNKNLYRQFNYWFTIAYMIA